MLRQVSSRNQRAKGFRVKHVLQISLFLAVSVWLLYQIKHSHDNKKAYEERISKNLAEFDESQADIFRFGRKDLPHTMETDSVSEARIEDEEDEEVGDSEQENKHEDSENGGGANNGMDEQNAGEKNGEVTESSLLEEQEHEAVSREAREKSFKGDDASSAVVHDTQMAEHEERSHEAQEMHFTGDDASSAVSHDAQVTEHEEGSHEEGEKSFNGDDMSGFIELNTQVTESKSEKEGSVGVDEKQLEKIGRKEIENETVANGTIDGLTGNYSSTIGLSEVSKTNDSSVSLENSGTTPNSNLTMNGNSVQKRESEVGASPTLEDGSFSNSTTAGESNNHMKQQADRSQLELLTNLTNVLNNEMELQTNSTTTSGNTMEPQMNSKTISNDQIESKTNMTVIHIVTNAVPFQNESATLDSVQDKNATVKMVTPSENATSSATDENGEKIAAESGNSVNNLAAGGNGDAHTDQPTLQDIQNKANSGGEEATA